MEFSTPLAVNHRADVVNSEVIARAGFQAKLARFVSIIALKSIVFGKVLTVFSKPVDQSEVAT